MLNAILKKLRQQVIWLLVVALVLLAAYVSAGRQFMPVVSRYADFFEEQVFIITGLPVTVETLTGSFQGFNPAVRVSGFSLLVGEEDLEDADPEASAFVFDQANLVIDIAKSIWQRRWVIDEFVMEGLSIDARQNEDGSWRLNDINFSSEGDLDLASVYQSFLQVSQLNLRNVRVNLFTRNQNTIALSNGSAVIQNRNGNHFLHVNANLGSSAEQLALSLEVRGDQLDQINGRLHFAVPNADYSPLFQNESVGEAALQELLGGGEFWVRFVAGRLTEVTAQVATERITFLTGNSDTLTLQDTGGKVKLLRGAEAGEFELQLEDMAVGWQQLQWAPFNAQLVLKPEQSISLKADHIDLSLLTQVALSSGSLSAAASEQLAAYAPGGALNNFSLFWPIAGSGAGEGLLRTNLEDVELGSVNGSPSLWGLDGYVEASYDHEMGLALGIGEVESQRFRINIPSLFVDTWRYDYVNGRLNFKVDLNAGQQVHLLSSVIVAESDVVDGRIQFASKTNRYDDGSRAAELDLMVGALRVDASRKSAYLPNAPAIADNLRNTMRWLDGAVIAGELKNSGVIFRGSTIRGSDPVTKTFQSFYVLEDGELLFSEAWPRLDGISGLVLTDDNVIDVEVSSASTLGIATNDVIAEVRRNEQGENLLNIEGKAAATTSTGLGYLQSAPVGEGLRNAVANWEAEGDFSADIKVQVPLSNPNSGTEVHLDIAINDNRLTMPSYALTFEKLTGPVVFDTGTGLETSVLTSKLFDETVAVELSSTINDGLIQSIQVKANGAVSPAALSEWPRGGSFVRQLLRDMEGHLSYEALVRLPQQNSGNPSLRVNSTLQGTRITLPQPFAKTTEAELPLQLDFEFNGTNQKISGALGTTTNLEVRLEDGAFQGGLIALGENWSEVDDQINTEASGLAVLGQVDYLEVGSWINYLTRINSSAGTASGTNLGSAIAFIDVMVDELEMYGQILADVGVRIENDDVQKLWAINLSGDAVNGLVQVPFRSGEYLTLDLDHLHLPGSDSAEEGAEEEASPVLAAPVAAAPEEGNADAEIVERVDVLAEVDPRRLPKMKFAADAITIGERPFGRFQFTLDPDADGAEFSDLQFDFRGLRVGFGDSATADAQTTEPHFSWHFDGSSHRSNLTGILRAANLADVLRANGFAPSLESTGARFTTNLSWPGSPAFFSAADLSGGIAMDIRDGRFQQEAGGSGALKLISIINFDAIMRRLRFSDDLLRRGLAYDSITGNLRLQDGHVTILDRLVISGPSSLYQITGELDLAKQTINGEMYLTLPVSQNIPWLGLLTANIPLAVGAYLFDRIFGDQVNNLTSAVYTLQGPWEGLQPQFKQAFGSPGSPAAAPAPAPQ